MKNFVVYKTTTGEILRTGRAPDDMLTIQAGAGETVIEGTANDATQYVAAGVVTNKPPMGCTINKTTMLANGVDSATISGVPNPTTARVSGPASSTATVIDGTLQLTFDLPGTYKVALTSINKLPQEFAINAT